MTALPYSFALKTSRYFLEKGKMPVGFEPNSTIVKLFQNVPKADLEMLFPNSEVKMRPIDKLIISSSALIGGAVVLVTKLGVNFTAYCLDCFLGRLAQRRSAYESAALYYLCNRHGCVWQLYI